MKLNHSQIPREFLENIPSGMKYVLRNGKDFLVVEQVFCPNGHSLMVNNVRLHGEPSIKLTLTVGETKGDVFLDAFWGSHDNLYAFLPDLSQVDAPGNHVCCPACGCSLIFEPEQECGECGSDKVVAMHLPNSQDNRILACSKLGCPWHRIVDKDIADKYRAMVDDINFFGI